MTTFACGISSFPYRRFLLVDSLAALAWATYTALLGFIGGNQFRDALWQPLLIGLGVALALGVAAEALREMRSREAGALPISGGSQGDRLARMGTPATRWRLWSAGVMCCALALLGG